MLHSLDGQSHGLALTAPCAFDFSFATAHGLPDTSHRPEAGDKRVPNAPVRLTEHEQIAGVRR